MIRQYTTIKFTHLEVRVVIYLSKGMRSDG